MSSMLTLAGNAAPTGFYDFPIEQSLRFEDGDNAYLSRTPASAGNRKTWTFSCWVKRGNIKQAHLLTAYTSSSDTTNIAFGTTDGNLQWYDYISGYRIQLSANALFRDVSAWYHLVFALDTTQATASDRAKIWVNGERVTSFYEETYPSQNADLKMNTAIEHRIGDTAQYAREFDGYLADVNFVDGTAYTADSFGELKSGIWIPKDTSGLTFGTNGFRLQFGDSAAIGDDTSGNTNDWTANNLVASDVVLDGVTNNFAVLAPVNNPTDNYSEGRLKFQGLTSAISPYSTSVLGTFGVSSGKWYYEARANTRSNGVTIGFAREGLMPADGSIPTYKVFGFNINDNTVTTNNSNTNDFTVTGASGDILGLAIDIDNGTASAYINGTLKGSVTGLNTSGYQNLPYATLGWASGGQTMTMNFGQDSTFAGNTTAGGNADENGYGDFAYAPPSGFLSLCSANLPSGAIDTLADETPEDYFSTLTYSGTGASNSVTGVGFQPDFTWIKQRTQAYSHELYDAVRGVQKALQSNTTSAESTETQGLTSFDSDGFTVGTRVNVNENSTNLVSWNWKAGGTGVSNTDGSITSTVSAAETSQGDKWFSVVKWTGNATAGATVGHGLTSQPRLIITKNMDVATDWSVLAQDANNGSGHLGYIRLNLTAAWASTSILWNNTEPTSSVFTLGSYGYVNGSGQDIIAYCFANAENLCRVGSYVGNGSTDGTFVFTGHKPSLLLIKETGNANSWELFDTARDPDNVASQRLFPNDSAAEATTNPSLDILSNGFKARAGNTGINRSGGSYIFLSISEQPFKYANAR